MAAKKTGKKAAAKKASAKKTIAKKSAARKAPAKKTTAKKAAARKAPAKKVAAKKAPAKKAAAKPVRLRDATGHLDPKYAADLRAQGGAPSEDERAFFKNPRSGDDLAEQLGEDVVGAATSGEDDGGDVANQVVTEEQGGPFVESDERTELAYDTDASNPADATREPFPTT
jgi:hypothetical protein